MKLKLMEKTSFLLSVTLLIHSCFSMVCLGRSIKNLTPDQSGLLAFKAHITYDPEEHLAKNWSSTSSVCNWVGVSCGVRHHRVTALNLSGMGLQGTIAPHLGNLSFLASLDISYNNLNGYVPQELSHLHRLNEINLKSNNFSGEIPSWFGLPKLNQLHLNENSFTGTIPKSLCNISTLEILYIGNNSLDGSIPREIGNLTMLKELYLGENNLEGCRHKKIKLQTQADSSPLAWRMVSYEELLQATDAFSETNLIGKGGYGSVYKGMLLDGMSIAIKVFNLKVEGAFKSFDVECEVMRNIRHRNLVKIISSCTNMDFKALVLEYMPNGSLEKWLYSHNYFLDILQRLNIMIDVGSALEYLHYAHTMPIVHCDLKPNNVLLDENMVAHVADFGIAKLFGEGDFMVQTMTLATIGYMAPEYGMEGRVSTRCDIYSYGVMLIEIFTRKKPTDELFAGDMSLKRWVNEALLDGSVIEIMDTNLIGRDDEHFSFNLECVSSILGLALDCSNETPEERISIKDALSKLEKIKISFLENI